MPRNDGTGPLGKGSMTGRGLGKCNDERAFGLGRRGRGMRGALGCRRGFGKFSYNDTTSPQSEKAILEKEKEILELELKDVNETLKNYSEDDKE